MVAISLYRGNLHLSGGADGAAPRRWEPPRPAISAKRFRRLVRSRSLAVARLAGAPPPTRPGSPASPAPSFSSSGEDAADEHQGQQLQDGGQQQAPQQLQQPEEGEVEQQQQVEEAEEQEEGGVEDADMNDAGEVVVEAVGNGDAEEGQGESEGVDPNQQVSSPGGIEEKKKKLNEKLDILNKKKHDLVQMLKQVLNAEEEIRMRNMQVSLRTAMPQPSENATDGSSVSRVAPRMTVDVNFGDIAVDSDAGSNQGTPGRPLHHFHSISPSTASFARSPFSSMHHHSGHTPRSPATFSTASPSRFAANGPQGQPPGLHSASLPGGYVASSPSPAASGGSSSVFRDPRPPNSM